MPNHATCLHDRACRLPDMSPIMHQASLGNSMHCTYWCPRTVDKRSPASINGRKAVDSKKPTVDCPSDRPPLYIKLTIIVIFYKM